MQSLLRRRVAIGELRRANLQFDDLVDQILGRLPGSIRVVEIFFEIPTLSLQIGEQCGKVVDVPHIRVYFKM